jgi:hypothetical protein
MWPRAYTVAITIVPKASEIIPEIRHGEGRIAVDDERGGH